LRGPLRALDALDDRVVGALGGLDRRFVPGLVRRPEIVVVLIGLLFLGAGGTRVALHDGGGPADPERVTVAADAPEQRGGEAPDGEALVVGPARGEDAAAYVARQRGALAEAAAADPRGQTVAIVSFDRYLTGPQAEEALDAVRPLAVRYRLPVDDPFAEEGVAGLTRGRVPVRGSLAAAVLPALREEGEQARAQAAELDTLIDSADDPEFSEAFRRDRNRLLAAAALVGESGCACVYAVEVQGRLRDLAALADHADVRLVDAAPPGTRGAVAFAALLPEETDRVGGP
jgi:hypothetical protein